MDSGKKRLFNPYSDDKNKVVVKEKYGFLPKSIWRITKSKDLVSYINDTIGGGSYSKKGGKKKKGQKDLSLLNPDVMYQILMYYTEPGDVVLAPYSSRGVVGFMCNLTGRNSFNTEIVRGYWENMKKRADGVTKKNDSSDLALEFYLDDARFLKKIPSNFADLTYFNPPYWNVEKYESTDGQMSDCPTYDDFLEFYETAIKSKFRCTKPGGWCIANLNDFRKDGQFYSFHTDTIRLMEDAGFVLHDTIINEIFSRSITSIGSVEKNGLKIMAKSHEYILVFKKPFKDGSVWKDYKDYRDNYRVEKDFKKVIKAYHKKIGFKPADGYSWE